jgi:hypothetical protein
MIEDLEAQALIAEASLVDERVAALLSRVAANAAEQPSAQTRREHLAAMLGPHMPLDEPRSRPVWRRVTVIAVAAMLSLVVLLAGLAYARVVTLPQPVRDVFSFFGMDLPGGAPASPAPSPAPTPASSSSPLTSVATPPSHPRVRVTAKPAPKPVSTPPIGSGRGDSNVGTKSGDSQTHSGQHCDVPQAICGI